jgi:hypothetical protein
MPEVPSGEVYCEVHCEDEPRAGEGARPNNCCVAQLPAHAACCYVYAVLNVCRAVNFCNRLSKICRKQRK